MKKLIAVILALAILTTSALAFGSGTGSPVYTNQWTLADGLTYRNDISSSASGYVETFTLETAPSGGVYPIVMACDTIYGGMTITRMISYAESLGYNVVGAVNADFGFWDTRVPCGMVVENGVYKSSPDGNNVIAFTGGSACVSYMPMVDITIANQTAGGSVSLQKLNKTRADDGLYLYSEYFSTVSTRTSGEGVFVRLSVGKGELGVSGTLELEVTEIVKDKTAVPIGKGNLVLTASSASGLTGELEKFHVGDKLTLTTKCSDERLSGAKWISGCGNYIVKDGAVHSEEYWDSSVTAANPRTAIGIKPDGSVVYYVMDGRSSASKGATMKELAKDLISMGCTDAVNMGGGGSTALALRFPGNDGFTIMNRPSDGALRSVCSYILFVTDAPANGAAKRLYAKQDGAFVLSGSSLDLGFTANNDALRTLNAGSVTATALTGSVSGGKYTAGAQAGVDIIQLSSGGITGSAALHVITRADTLSVTDSATGKAVTSLRMDPGQSVALSVAAKYLLRDVYMNASSVSYIVTDGVGSMKNGVFTAADVPGTEGTLTVSAAGLTCEITVSVAFEFPDMLSHWARQYVKTLYDAGAVEGTGERTFSPDRGMKRGDFLLMLWRAAGRPTPVSSEAPFADVPADSYYAAAIAWGKEQGVAQGDGGYFNPEGILDRQQGFTFLYRAFAALKVSYPDGDAAALAAYSDAATLADWAAVPTATLIKAGIVEGDAGLLTPAATLTRAQMAKLMCLVAYK